MKTYLRSVALTIALVAGGSMTSLHAQQASTAGSVSAGTLSLNLDASFTTSLKDQGITVTYLSNEADKKNKPVFPVEGGYIDTTNGTSEVQTGGGVRFAAGKNSVTLERLALESNTTSNAHITALVLVNGVAMGRKAVLTVTGGSAFTFPIKYGQVSSGDLTFKVNPAFVSEISDYFQVSANTYKGMIGELSLNLLVGPQL